MPTALDDFTVDQRGNLSHRVIGWAVEFVSLGGGIVVLEHMFEGLADVDSLQKFDVN